MNTVRILSLSLLLLLLFPMLAGGANIQESLDETTYFSYTVILDGHSFPDITSAFGLEAAMIAGMTDGAVAS